MNRATELPQPWEALGLTRSDYMSAALERESRESVILVVETLVNGYAVDEEHGWVADYVTYHDWRTSSLLWGYDPIKGEQGPNTGSFLIVERRNIDA